MEDTSNNVLEIPSDLPGDLTPYWSDLPLRQRNFVIEYLKDENGTKAAERAGYSKKGCAVRASELLHSRKVQPIVKALLRAKDSARRADIDWFISECRRNYDRCMQAVEVRDKTGRILKGVWKYDPYTAAKFLEMIGRAQSIFKRAVDPSEAPDSGGNHYAAAPPSPSSVTEWAKQMEALGYEVRLPAQRNEIPEGPIFPPEEAIPGD